MVLKSFLPCLYLSLHLFPCPVMLWDNGHFIDPVVHLFQFLRPVNCDILYITLSSSTGKDHLEIF